MRSLRDKVLPLPDDTVVLPGHGPATTIGRERATNPYLRRGGVGDARVTSCSTAAPRAPTPRRRGQLSQTHARCPASRSGCPRSA